MNPAGHDPARSLLTQAVRGLPPERQDWGQAMLAELDQLQDRWARWRFALGCVRVVLAPPRATPTPGLAMRAAVVVGAVAMGVGISLVAPALQLFAVLFTVLLTGVAAAVGVVLYGVVRYPGAVGEPWDPVLILLSVTLAATLSGYVWMALVPPQAATTHLVVVVDRQLAGKERRPRGRSRPRPARRR